jgi:hypothetical protein
VCRSLLERQLYITLSASGWTIGFALLVTLLFTGSTWGLREVGDSWLVFTLHLLGLQKTQLGPCAPTDCSDAEQSVTVRWL